MHQNHIYLTLIEMIQVISVGFYWCQNHESERSVLKINAFEMDFHEKKTAALDSKQKMTSTISADLA